MLCTDLHIKSADESKEQSDNYIDIEEDIYLH